MHIRLKITFYLLIILVSISPPSLFSEIDLGREMRLLFGIIIMILLFFESSKFKIRDFIVFLLLGFIILVEVIFQRSETFLNLWSSSTLPIAILAIISFVIHQFSSFNADFLNFSSSDLFNPEYNYRMSIFGFTMIKDFGFVDVVRVCSFFNEPQYAGMFFAFNMLLIKNRVKSISKKHFFINLLAGLLTFSVTFYLAFFVLTIFSMKQKYIKIFFYSLLIIFVYYVFISDVSINTLIEGTSFSDRIDRNMYALDYLMNKASILNILFGHGIGNYQLVNEDELGRGLSAGFLYLMIESGCASILFYIFLVSLLSNNNRFVILIAMLYMFAIPWHKYYFCWYVIILCGLNHVNSFHHKNTDNKNGFLN